MVIGLILDDTWSSCKLRHEHGTGRRRSLVRYLRAHQGTKEAPTVMELRLLLLLVYYHVVGTGIASGRRTHGCQ